MHVIQLCLSFLNFFMCFPAKILAFVVIEFSYLPFHTTFDRGLKVRLLCSPQWLSPLGWNVYEVVLDNNEAYSKFSLNGICNGHHIILMSRERGPCDDCYKHTPPKRRFWKPNQPFRNGIRMRFRSTFQGSEYSIWDMIHWKVLRNAFGFHFGKVGWASKIFVWGA
jgi:hypothetical protein